MDLGSARVLCVGAGGLGSPAAYYLAAAGVGHLGILDSDRVDLTNLQRQILHRTEDVGRLKTDSAADALARRHPSLRLTLHRVRLDVDNALEIFGGYDLILDGSDNFRTKFLCNDAAVLSGKPLVHGGILRWFGQFFVVLPGRTACYRCLFEAPPPAHEIPSCEDAGVMGAVAGAFGALMAAEAVKTLTGTGRLLADRILTMDLLGLHPREIAIRRNPRCPVCGETPTIRALCAENYLEGECSVPRST
jgi:adenylyltransferase/sulfurtransferase